MNGTAKAIILVMTCFTLAMSGTNVKDRIPSKPVKIVTYKTIDKIKLRMHIFVPENHDPKIKSSAIIFFFGGGWSSGTPKQFYQQCRYLASRGMVAMSAEYRVKSRHGTSPFECVKDAKSAIRWVRTHAGKLGVDPNKIVSGGGSAGGHIAACTAMIENMENKGEDLSISSKPNALVLFNPVLGLTENDKNADKITERIRKILPADHVKEGLPPFIIFHGAEDTTVPVAAIEIFQKLMNNKGNRCEVVPFKGRKHGFFNYGRNNNEPFNKTMELTDKFLTSRGFLKKADGRRDGDGKE
ncbi:alpha/beta hydrolase [Verrucomicrobiota bacterium]